MLWGKKVTYFSVEVKRQFRQRLDCRGIIRRHQCAEQEQTLLFSAPAFGRHDKPFQYSLSDLSLLSSTSSKHLLGSVDWIHGLAFPHHVHTHLPSTVWPKTRAEQVTWDRRERGRMSLAMLLCVNWLEGEAGGIQEGEMNKGQSTVISRL